MSGASPSPFSAVMYNRLYSEVSDCRKAWVMYLVPVFILGKYSSKESASSWMKRCTVGVFVAIVFKSESA